MHNIKAVFFDLDGTIIDPITHTIPQKNLEAIQQLANHGIKIFVATGRSFEMLANIEGLLTLPWTGFICSNGQRLFDGTGKEIESHYFTKEQVKQLLAFCKEEKMAVSLVTPTVRFAPLGISDYVVEAHTFFHEPLPEVIKEYHDENIYMGLIYNDRSYDFHKVSNIEGLLALPNQSTYADVVLAGISKASGMATMGSLYGFTLDETMAFGDSGNDIMMLKAAAFSVAMGTGSDEVKAASQFVTKDVSQGGIGYALRHMHLLDPLLIQPLSIRHLQLKNRLVMPPMATAKTDENDIITDDILAYYKDKTSTEKIGMVIVEHAYVLKQGKANKRQISVAEDNVIPGLSRLADTIHQSGAKAVMQINHAGNAALSMYTGMPVLGPSVMIHPGTKEECQAMTQKDIDQVIEAFRLAALRVQASGFDGVEIHGAHGYLLSQFYSPKTNFRQDEYGGSLDHRIRLHLQIIRAIKQSVNDNFLVMMRLGASDYASQGGATIEDGVLAAQQFERAGINVIDVTGGLRGFIHPASKKPGWFKDASLAIRQSVSVPVILTGGVTEVNQAEQLLEDGCADLIGVGRSLLQDSSWPAQLPASKQHNNEK